MGIYPKHILPYSQYHFIEQNKCNIFYFSYKKLNEISKYPYDVITDYLKLKEEISKYISWVHI